MWVTVRAASHPPVWIHRKCELRSLKKMLKGLCWVDDYAIAQWLEHRWLQARVPGSSPGGDSQFFLQTFPVCLFPSNQLILFLLLLLLTGLRERDKREKSEEKIDCHHQDSNQGPSLVASDALTTELCYYYYYYYYYYYLNKRRGDNNLITAISNTSWIDICVHCIHVL